MTEKEKAEELLDEFMDYAEFRFNEKNNLSNVHTAKQYVLIAVNELIKETGKKWWYDVKKELENL